MIAGFWPLENGAGALPYATRSLSATQARALRQPDGPGRAEGLNLPGAPVVLRGPAQMAPPFATLRICDLRPAFRRPPQAQDLAQAEAQFAYLQAAMVAIAGPHDRPLRHLIETYFAALRARVALDQSALKARTGDLAGLVQPLHWAFLAPLPLPLAHPAPADAGGAGEQALPCIDLAFCTQAGLVALFADRGSLTPGARRARAALGAQGVVVHEVTAATAQTVIDQHILGPDPFGLRPGSGAPALPASPFGGQPIGAPRP